MLLFAFVGVFAILTVSYMVAVMRHPFAGMNYDAGEEKP
jgi:hypothetical protein